MKALAAPVPRQNPIRVYGYTERMDREVHAFDQVRMPRPDDLLRRRLPATCGSRVPRSLQHGAESPGTRQNDRLPCSVSHEGLRARALPRATQRGAPPLPSRSGVASPPPPLAWSPAVNRGAPTAAPVLTSATTRPTRTDEWNVLRNIVDHRMRRACCGLPISARWEAGSSVVLVSGPYAVQRFSIPRRKARILSSTASGSRHAGGPRMDIRARSPGPRASSSIVVTKSKILRRSSGSTNVPTSRPRR